MSDEHSFTIRLTHEQDFQFRVAFDAPQMATLLVDEPAPLGKDEGPNAARLVAAAVANCLSASLLFSMRKFKQDPGPLTAEATAHLARNERGRVRIVRIDVAIQLGVEGSKLEHRERALGQFEDFCIVTESIRHGVPVRVVVRDAAGLVLHEA